jgi:hypothetical protein
MQVQRGIGASTVAVPSVGGTINITTMGTDAQQGGTVYQSIGSYNSLKHWFLIQQVSMIKDGGLHSCYRAARAMVMPKVFIIPDIAILLTSQKF